MAAFKILSQDDENTGLVEVAVLKDVMAYVGVQHVALLLVKFQCFTPLFVLLHLCLCVDR